MKNKTFRDSLKCAFSGLSFALKTEKNFKYYLGIATFFLVVNILVKASLIEFIAFIIATGGVFSAECMNTALEHLANTITTEFKTTIKYAKDIAAASVLVWGFVFFAIEILIIVFKFI